MSFNYAGRFNSFVFKNATVYDAIDSYTRMKGITHLEFNYPEHFTGYDIEEIIRRKGHLGVNGLAVRWRGPDFKPGNFTNENQHTRDKVIAMCRDAVDVCRKLDGSVITLWLENDGFDYPFQMDYERAFYQIVDGVREAADYAAGSEGKKEIKISIEYKPYEERNFAMIDSTGMVMYLLSEIDRPNVGCTLDFCHMLMKHDNPSYGIALAARKGKLFGLHMNEGYGWQDSGMIFGSVSPVLAMEFIYYLRLYNYQGVVFFDTFPIREDPFQETQANIDAFEKINALVDKIGMDKIARVIRSKDGVQVSRLMLEMLK
ncbi:MAG: TIM barrel protein [Synergistaceae bacterium]|nr:TIM barrel protein [Synergistaceae bacterium]